MNSKLKYIVNLWGILVLFGICCSSVLTAQQLPINVKLDYPKFVPENSEFQISIITRLSDIKGNSKYLEVVSESGVELIQAELRNIEYSEKILFKNSDNSYDVKNYLINLSTIRNAIDLTLPVQIVLSLTKSNKFSKKKMFNMKFKGFMVSTILF